MRNDFGIRHHEAGSKKAPVPSKQGRTGSSAGCGDKPHTDTYKKGGKKSADKKGGLKKAHKKK